jgi:hypothetical protein
MTEIVGRSIPGGTRSVLRLLNVLDEQGDCLDVRRHRAHPPSRLSLE